ncbi:hypothetical protein M153_16780001776 [Pseudoloma neurophilia]|uniref:Uncharacterized protein n=1 Tax=Pseudoloma neurophilia TaxID=146866 RepID=A0A0R0M202_9MICR|nr:hypothetical protein M153_16780001776 [Pseudoloma neurophilia]
MAGPSFHFYPDEYLEKDLEIEIPISHYTTITEDEIEEFPMPSENLKSVIIDPGIKNFLLQKK